MEVNVFGKKTLFKSEQLENTESGNSVILVWLSFKDCKLPQLSKAYSWIVETEAGNTIFYNKVQP